MLMQLNSLSTKVQGDRILFDTDEREHDDYAWSLALAVKAANRYIPTEEGDRSVNAALWVGGDDLMFGGGNSVEDAAWLMLTREHGVYG
jgi:hypothetical protein